MSSVIKIRKRRALFKMSSINPRIVPRKLGLTSTIRYFEPSVGASIPQFLRDSYGETLRYRSGARPMYTRAPRSSGSRISHTFCAGRDKRSARLRLARMKSSPRVPDFRAAALASVGGPAGWVREIESVAGAS
ncbi:hypothetical protein KM043_009199 [Ampulex compressa]|nr:hypothetical protein KM043_009199 [Ampulex compressa]